MGLNGLRIHIKPDEPRRLYWADRLGVLILEDMPNTWQQNAGARAAWEKTMREAVARDRNHPAIITWVAFNETWGLGKPEDYKKDRDTQEWVGEMVQAIRKLDPTRLVEDNSPCNYDHIVNTDLNSWHFYIDDHARGQGAHPATWSTQTRPGSGFNYCPGLTQSNLPADQLRIRGGLGRRRRPRHLVGPPRPDHAVAPAPQDPGIRLHRAGRHRVGAQRPGQLRPHAQAVRLRRLGARHEAQRNPDGADFVGYDAPPAIVGKPGETITVPVFVSHYSDRTFQPKLQVVGQRLRLTGPTSG